MPKFLIEVPHEDSKEACLAAIRVFMSTGSHFLTNADWGCLDGVHKSWITVDVDNKDEARMIIPPAYRAHASIVSLNRFSMNDAREIAAQHPTAH